MRAPYNQTILEELYHLASYSSGYFFSLLLHNGQPIKFHLTPEQEQAKQTAMAGDYVTYDHFLRLMKANSYNQEGYAASLVNQKCKKAFVP